MNSAERLVERARGGDRAAWAELLPEGWLERTDGPSTSSPDGYIRRTGSARTRAADAVPKRTPELRIVAMIMVAAISTIALAVIMLTSSSGPDAERQPAPTIDYNGPTDATSPTQAGSISPPPPSKVPPTGRTTKAPRTSKPTVQASAPPPLSRPRGIPQFGDRQGFHRPRW